MLKSALSGYNPVADDTVLSSFV